jgi:hypothetical protein
MILHLNKTGRWGDPAELIGDLGTHTNAVGRLKPDLPSSLFVNWLFKSMTLAGWQKIEGGG